MIATGVIKLCRAMQEAGGRGLLVGGWVRDFLRQSSPPAQALSATLTTDYDIECFGLPAETLKSLLTAHGIVNAVGEAFTVFKVRLYDPTAQPKSFVVDVSLPRREAKTGEGHRGFTVTGDPWMTPQEAARRRDFTINAMMLDPLTGEVLDPYGGQVDLQRRILRVVDPRTFIEDSLRVLRAMQFAARFGFTIEPETVALCRRISLTDLPAERIWAEVEKWLLQATQPSIGWWAARELGITQQLWPEIHALIDCPQAPHAHPEGDVFTHNGMVLDAARQLVDDLPHPKRLAVMLGALCHDFGKPLVTRETAHGLSAYGHEEAGVPLVEAFLGRLKVFTVDHYDVRRQTLALVRWHGLPHQWFKTADAITDGQFRRLALQVEPQLLYRVARADCVGRAGNFAPQAEEWFWQRVQQLGIEEHAPAPLLQGRHLLELGLTPGRRVGELIHAVYELQLDGEVTTLAAAIAAAQHLLTEKTA